MSAQGIMSGKKANNDAGMCSVKGQYSATCRWTSIRNRISSLSVSTTRTTLREWLISHMHNLGTVNNALFSDTNLGIRIFKLDFILSTTFVTSIEFN